MASPSTDADLEAQTNSVTEAQPANILSPPPTADAPNPQSPNPQPHVTNPNEHPNGNTPAPQIPDNSQVQRDENHGDSSDGLWSIYLTESEKQDTEVTESWNGDTNGILVFTGLFSATVAAFIIESYKMLSPDSSEKTNTILAQISAQLVNISNGTPLASVTVQSIRPFKPTSSAVRVNVFWFLSLILSLNCALSATLMQQWARRYRELAQRRGAFHRRGRMRAYIFDGINKFGMARVVATMPTLLHISVFLFFAGLIDFLFPIYTTVAYSAVGCIGAFTLAYTVLTVLPIIRFNCPYATPLSGFTWRISQFSVFVFLWTILQIRGLYRKSRLKLWNLAKQCARRIYGPKKWWKILSRFILFIPWIPIFICACTIMTVQILYYKSLSISRILANQNSRGTYGPKKWWKILSRFTRSIPWVPVSVYNWVILTNRGLYRKSLSKLRGLVNQLVPETRGQKKWWGQLDEQVKIRRQWFSQSLRKTAELSAYRAESMVVTSALEWTLTALDEDKEIEEFAAQVPGFFDSRVVPDATSAVLSLMSHQPNADPIFGSRLNDLLKTCIPETSILDEKMRKKRLSVCVKCLWYFGKAYNQSESSQVVPSYFLNAFITPEITRRIQAEEDSGIRMIGRCFGALVMNKLARDFESRTDSISDGELARLSAILGTDSDDLKILFQEPGAVAFANMISIPFGEVGPLVADGVPRDVLDVVQQTMTILSQALPAQANAELQPEWTTVIFNGVDGNFGRMLVSRFLDIFNARILVPSRLTEEVRTSCLRICLKGLWYSVFALNQLGHSVTLSSFTSVTFTNPDMTNRIRKQGDLAVHVIGRCVEALVVNKLVADIKSRNVPASIDELAYLSAVLGTKSDDVMLLLDYPGAIEITNIAFLALDDGYIYPFDRLPSYLLDVIQQTSGALFRALPPSLNTKMRLDTLMNVSDGTSSLTGEMYWSVLRASMKNLWDFTREYHESGNSLPSFVCIAFANPEMTRRICEQRAPTVRVIGRCVGALVVNKLAADIKSRNVSASNDELACLSAVLDTKSDDVKLLLRHPGAIEIANMVFLALDYRYIYPSDRLPSYVLDVVQQTSSALSQVLPPSLNTKMQLDQTDTIIDVSDGTSSLTGEIYRSVLRVWMKNLWDFTREYNESGNSLPSCVCIAFTNPEMTRRIREHNDLTVYVIGRCVGALVINKLMADTKSRNVPASNDELACLSAVLGTKSDDVKLMLRHPGAIEFTNIAFLTLDDRYISPYDSFPSYVLDIVQQTSSALFRALPPSLNTKMRLDTPMNVSDGTSSLTGEMYWSVLRAWMKNLWDFTRVYNESGNSLPSYVCIPFTNPEMTRRMCEQRALTVRVIGRCVGALVVNKLAADIESRNVLASNDELACLSAVLGTESNDIRLFLSRPGTIELVNLASLAFGDAGSSCAGLMTPGTRYVVQQTSGILSRARLAQEDPGPPLDQTVALVNVSNDDFESTTVSRLGSLLEMCLQGASSLADEVRTSCLRICLKGLWQCGKAHLQNSVSLPSYFPLVLCRPEIIRHFKTEQDPVSRITGCCFGALVLCVLVSPYKLPISLSDRDRNAELACISAILGAEHREGLFLSHQLHIINLRNVISLISGEIDTLSTGTGMAVDVLNTAQDTLYILANFLRREAYRFLDLPRDKQLLLRDIFCDVENTLRSDQLKTETAKTLDRLNQILGRLPPDVEQPQDAVIQIIDH